MSGRTYPSPVGQWIAARGFEPLARGRTQDPANDDPTVRDRPLRAVREVEMVGEGRVDALRHVRRKSLGVENLPNVDLLGAKSDEVLGQCPLDEEAQPALLPLRPIQHHVNMKRAIMTLSISPIWRVFENRHSHELLPSSPCGLHAIPLTTKAMPHLRAKDVVMPRRRLASALTNGRVQGDRDRDGKFPTEGVGKAFRMQYRTRTFRTQAVAFAKPFSIRMLGPLVHADCHDDDDLLKSF